MKSVILDAAGEGEVPPLRWRAFQDRNLACWVGGIMLFAGPEWGLHVYLGRWIIGIERAREEDD